MYLNKQNVIKKEWYPNKSTSDHVTKPNRNPD